MYLMRTANIFFYIPIQRAHTVTNQLGKGLQLFAETAVTTCQHTTQGFTCCAGEAAVHSAASAADTPCEGTSQTACPAGS